MGEIYNSFSDRNGTKSIPFELAQTFVGLYKVVHTLPRPPPEYYQEHLIK